MNLQNEAHVFQMILCKSVETLSTNSRNRNKYKEKRKKKKKNKYKNTPDNRKSSNWQKLYTLMGKVKVDTPDLLMATSTPWVESMFIQ